LPILTNFNKQGWCHQKTATKASQLTTASYTLQQPVATAAARAAPMPAAEEIAEMVAAATSADMGL